MQISPYTAALTAWLASSTTGGSGLGGASLTAPGATGAAWSLTDALSLSGAARAAPASAPWQFDLGAVYQPAAAAATPVSDAQTKEETNTLKLALALIDAGDTASARNVLDGLLAKNRTHAAAVHALGLAALTDGEFAEAERQFLKAHALNQTVGYDNDARNAKVLQKPDADVLATARAWAAEPSRRGESLRLLIELTRRNTNLPAANLALGDALLAQGDRANGLMQYSIALTKAQGEDLTSVEARINRLAARETNSAYLRELQGKALLQRGRYAEAAVTLRQAAELSENRALTDRELAKAHVGLGREALSRGELRAALSQFEYARELSPSGAEVKLALREGYLVRAERAAAAGRGADALEDYARFAALDDGRTGAALRKRAAAGAFALGRRLQREREAVGAPVDSEVQAYQIAHDLAPDDRTYKRRLADARVALGDQYQKDGLLEQAAYAYERAHTLFRSDAAYKHKTVAGFLALGDAHAGVQFWDQAVDAYARAFKIDAGDATSRTRLADARNSRGLELAAQGKYAHADRDFKEALRLFPDNATYQANYDAYKAWDF